MNSLSAYDIILNTFNLKTYAKDLALYNKNFIELRQINIFSLSATITSVETYTVTAEHADWTAQYYGITGFPYTVMVLPEVYDNIIQGFTRLYFAYPIGMAIGIATIDDKYMLNQFRNKTTRFAQLFISSTSITSSLTSFPEDITTTVSFIDYQNGIIIIKKDSASAQELTYSSAVQITDNQFICIAKANEFNRTTNPSAYGLTGNTPISDYEVPYVTGIGIYDDNANLLAVAKLSSPIKKSNKIDIVFKIQIDM